MNIAVKDRIFIKLFYLLNIIVPIVIGGAFYYVSLPNVRFVRIIDHFLPRVVLWKYHEELWIIKLFRNYALDMLWAYALVFAVYLVLGSNTALWKVLTGVFFFSVMMESLQVSPAIRGTFDVWDLVAEIFAEIIAVIIIKKRIILRGGTREYEKNV